jgi:hypothetical protein
MNTTTSKSGGICADIFLGLREFKKKSEGVCDVNEIGYPLASGPDGSEIIVTDTDGRSYEVIVNPL